MGKEASRHLEELEERVFGGIVSAVRASDMRVADKRRLLDEAMGALVDAQDALDAAGQDASRCRDALAAAAARLDAVERSMAG